MSRRTASTSLPRLASSHVPVRMTEATVSGAVASSAAATRARASATFTTGAASNTPSASANRSATWSTRRSVAKRGWARSARMRSPRAMVARTRASAIPPKRVNTSSSRNCEYASRSRPGPRAAPAPAPCRRPARRSGPHRPRAAGQRWAAVEDDLPVSDRDEVGRNIGGEVPRLGFGDRQCVTEPPPSSGASFAARSSKRAWT